MILFEASDEQLLKFFNKIIEASHPVGLGCLQFDSETPMSMEMMKEGWKYREFSIDYYEGKMVKISVKRIDDHVYCIEDTRVSSDYQSWSTLYKSYEQVLEDCGIEVETSRFQILGLVDDLMGQFLYYSRKEDDDVPVGYIERAILQGDITAEEIANKIKKVLDNSVEEERAKTDDVQCDGEE